MFCSPLLGNRHFFLIPVRAQSRKASVSGSLEDFGNSASQEEALTRQLQRSGLAQSSRYCTAKQSLF